MVRGKWNYAKNKRWLPLNVSTGRKSKSGRDCRTNSWPLIAVPRKFVPLLSGHIPHANLTTVNVPSNQKKKLITRCAKELWKWDLSMRGVGQPHLCFAFCHFRNWAEEDWRGPVERERRPDNDRILCDLFPRTGPLIYWS